MSSARDEQDQDADVRSRLRLNVVLYAAVVLCTCLVVLLAVIWWNGREDEVDGVPVSVGAGEDVGRGTVQAVKLADEVDQERVAAQIEAATTMVTAFINFDYKNPEKTMDSVRSLSTGRFLKQYKNGTEGILELTKKAESTQTGRVVWAGLVAGDDDSATVIVATSGTVANKTTEFKEQARDYRIQLELVLKEDKWLVRDLQIVA